MRRANWMASIGVVAMLTMMASADVTPVPVLEWHLDDASGSLGLSNSGSIGGIASTGGAALVTPGQTGTGAALLNEATDYISQATGRSGVAEGTVQVWANTYASNPTTTYLVNGRNSSATQLRIMIIKDSAGVYVDARSRYWDGGWKESIVNNWATDKRVNFTSQWALITYTWGSRGKELWIGDQLVASNAADTNPVHELYTLGIGDITGGGATTRGSYDEFRFYDQQIPADMIPEPATIGLLGAGLSVLLSKKK